MNKIALDATYAADPEPTGVGIYSRRLISALAASAPFQRGGDCRLVLAFRPGPLVRAARKMKWPDQCSLSPLFESFPVPWGVRLFHGLNQRLTGASYPLTVVTIHDLFPLTSGEYSKPGFQAHFSEILRRSIAKADRIVAVSNATRLQILERTSAREERIRVVHHGVDPAERPAQSEVDAYKKNALGLAPGENFFLNVGTIQVRKNTSNIVLAMRSLPNRRLVLAGGIGHGAEETLAIIEREGLRDRVIRIGHAPRSALGLLYSAATALVFPSLEEGFGFPVLEAMSYGLPVITSNRSSMPEVAGDAALLVDPGSPEEIASAMRRIEEDAPLAASLREKGLRRASMFTWERCAEKTWEVYRELL